MDRCLVSKDITFQLMEKAKEAMKAAYVPYSGYTVGAALLAGDGTIYTGCNIENAAYSPTCCAERVAFFKAVSSGQRKFTAIAVCGGKDCHIADAFPPCGVCRQVMQEFCDPSEFVIIVMKPDTYEEFLLKELLPYGFDNSHMC